MGKTRIFRNHPVMNNTLVVWYSRKGSNRYLASRIAGSLQCELEEIRPRLNSFLLFLMGIHLGNRSLRHKPVDYDQVILCGPVWMGKFIPPLRAFVRKYGQSLRKMVFVTCCGSSYAVKDEKFGHGLVFNQVKELLGDKCVHCEAFPIGLVMPADKQDDGELMMKTVLSDANFTGEILERYEQLIRKLREG
jgi:flavodoxin